MELSRYHFWALLIIAILIIIFWEEIKKCFDGTSSSPTSGSQSFYTSERKRIVRKKKEKEKEKEIYKPLEYNIIKDEDEDEKKENIKATKKENLTLKQKIYELKRKEQMKMNEQLRKNKKNDKKSDFSFFFDQDQQYQNSHYD